MQIAEAQMAAHQREQVEAPLVIEHSHHFEDVGHLVRHLLIFPQHQFHLLSGKPGLVIGVVPWS